MIISYHPSSFISQSPGTTIIIFFLIFILINQVQDSSCQQQRNCFTNFTCGGGMNIGYPFYGNNRPDYCGFPGYKLDCTSNNSFTEITIISQKYRVLQINQAYRIMRITRSDFMVDDDACPENFTNTNLNTTLFSYPQTGYLNLTLSYDCPSELKGGLLNKFTCRNNETSSGDAYFWSKNLGDGVNPNCRENMEVPISILDFGRLASDPKKLLLPILREGFNVTYYVYDEARTGIDACVSCVESGGSCGYNSSSSSGFVCYCPNGITSTCSADHGVSADHAKRSKRKKVQIGIGAGVSGSLIAVSLLILVLRKIYSWKKENDDQTLEAFFGNGGSIVSKRFRYTEVDKMTNSFKEKLGQGGYGSVFKGQLQDGRLVAVKVLSNKSTSNNGEEFLNEVASISRTSHINIVSLLGFCYEKDKQALIYEFMPNGSLDKFIYNKNISLESSLEWKILYEIAIGIARGLGYLHRGCSTRIIHFDIKPHNILLDDDFSPKIADFGLAKLCPGKESIISMLDARGTAGYIAPEVFSRNFGGVSHKSDVYSYGMMILEMVGGRKNFDVKVGKDHSSQLYFPDWIYDRLNLEGGLGLQGIMIEESKEVVAKKMIIVGLWCIQINPPSRPSMSKVLEMLEGNLEALQIPPKPFLYSPARSWRSETGSSTLIDSK